MVPAYYANNARSIVKDATPYQNVWNAKEIAKVINVIVQVDSTAIAKIMISVYLVITCVDSVISMDV